MVYVDAPLETDRPVRSRNKMSHLIADSTRELNAMAQKIGVALVTSVGCNNGCSDEEEEEKPKRKKRATAAASESGELCPKTDDCDRPTGHTGRCNHNGKVEAE